MAQEPAVSGVGIDEEHPAPQRKGVLVRRGAFGVKREVFSVAKMSVPARQLLQKRLSSELDAVRDALRKAEVLSSLSAGATGAPAPAGGKDRQLLDTEAPAEEDGGRAAKKRKVCPFALQDAREPKQMRTDGRERLAGRLASLAAALPDHAVAFLQNQRAWDADSRGSGDGGMEKDVLSMKDGAGPLFQLKMLLDKFAPESTPPPKSLGCAPLVARWPRRHQGVGGKMATVQEEVEEADGVDICGGVSRIAIRDIAEEYGELVEDIGVKLLSPLQRKYVDLAEHGEYVDICGDASPVVFPAKAGDGRSTSPSLSSSYSCSSLNGSDSSSSSDSDSESDPGKSISSRPPLATLPEEKGTGAQPPMPAPEPVYTVEPEDVQDQCVPPPPMPVVLLTKVNDINVQPLEPAPETMHIAEQEELQDQCAPPPPAPPVHPVTSNPPEQAALPKENGTYTQPPQPAAEAVQIAAETEELLSQCVAPVATGQQITGGSAPPSAALPGENGASSQPPTELAPVLAQVAEPEEVKVKGEGTAPAIDLSGLVTKAKEEAERRQQLAKERAKAKARRVLLEVERAVPPDERVHPRDLELLGITAFEHVASTVQDARTAAQPQVDEGGGFRVSPGGPSVLQQLGVFLKADDGSDDNDEEGQQPPPPPSVAAFASHGEDMEVEDGEIR